VAEIPSTAPSASAASSTKSGGSGVSAGNASAAPNGTNAPQENAVGSGSALIWAGVVILLVLAALVAIRIVNMSRRNKKHRQYNYKQNSTRLKR
jgi:hypothetical protein